MPLQSIGGLEGMDHDGGCEWGRQPRDRTNQISDYEISGRDHESPNWSAVMPTWELPPVTEQPSIQLARWTVVRLAATDGSLEADFLFGWDPQNRCGRSSTNIVDADPANQTILTRSGRRYELVGPPGHDPDGEHVFLSKFGAALKLCHQEIVSDQYARPTTAE